MYNHIKKVKYLDKTWHEIHAKHVCSGMQISESIEGPFKGVADIRLYPKNCKITFTDGSETWVPNIRSFIYKF